MSRLVTFGDSWPAGAELDSEGKTYGEILSKLLDLNFENYAQPATSNGHMILQLKQYIDNHEDVKGDTAIFFITSPTRSIYIDYDNLPHEIYPWADTSKGDQAYYYYKFFHTPAQEKFNLNTWILSLQRICDYVKLNDYYVVGWSDFKFDFPGIDTTKIYAKTCAEMFGVSGEHEFTLASESMYVKPNNDHPNQKGHQLIAETLAKWINNE
jgi:hypothetical protein